MYKVEKTLFGKVTMTINYILILITIAAPFVISYINFLSDTENIKKTGVLLLFFIALSIGVIRFITETVPFLILYGIYFWKHPNGMAINDDKITMTRLFSKTSVPIEEVSFVIRKSMFRKRDYYVMLYANKRKNVSLFPSTYKNLDEFVNMVNEYNRVV